MLRYIRYDWTAPKARQTADGLLRIKTQLSRAKLPKKSADNLLIATWNIREFGSGKKYGARNDEAIIYLAEVISAFDIVAIQEVRNELGDFRRLMQFLGNEYDYLLTDITVGAAGNQERMAFVYDRQRVRFGGFAGQVVLPPRPAGKSTRPAQPARAPFMVGFQVGWLRFIICTAHIYYGTKASNEPRRVAEIDLLSQLLVARAQDPHAWARNYVLLGDFNIFKTTDETYKSLVKNGFRVPKGIMGVTTDLAGKHCYDQIAFLAGVLERQLKVAKGGTASLFNAVYRDDGEDRYAAEMGPGYAKQKSVPSKTRYYKAWRTFQMSDHRPLWIELKVDFTRGFLANRLRGKALHPSIPDVAAD